MDSKPQVWECSTNPKHKLVKVYGKATAVVCGECAKQHPTRQSVVDGITKWSMKVKQASR